MTDFIDYGVERDLLNKWGGRMATNLITHAKASNIDLRPLLDTGYNWFEWLGMAWNDEGVTRDLVFWGLSHPYAQHFAKDDQPEIYEARRWQVAQHAIKLIGRELYPVNNIRWEEITYTPRGEYIERSWPCVFEVNGELMTVYFVSWCDLGPDGWRCALIALSVEQLTEFDWLEWAGMRPNNPDVYEAYTMNTLLEDLVREGQGAYMWQGPVRKLLATTLDDGRQQAKEIATNFEHEIYGQQLYDHGTRAVDLRATGGEHTWKELREFRQRFGGGDGKAIDRHSIRVYSYGRQRYTLDRINSVSPPCFTLYYQDRLQRVFTPVVLIEGQAMWGDNLSWEKAEEIAKKAAHDRTFARFS